MIAYTGHDGIRARTGRAHGTAAEFAERAFNAGWRSLTITGFGDRKDHVLGEIKADDQGRRRWWAER